MSGSGASVGELFDAVAGGYDHAGTEYFAPMGRRLVDLSGVTVADRVLDVGTGRGAVLVPAAAAVGPNGSVLGVDLSRRMALMTAADLRRLEAPVRAAVVVGDAARPPVAGPFDAVLGGMVAQFLPAPERALRSWAALVRPGGRLVLSWWAGEDPRYAHLGGIVARHVPTDQRQPAPRPFSGDVVATDALVAANGWTDVATVVERQRVVFADRTAWWRWSWSHGQRRQWQAVTDFRALEREVNAELARLAEPDGRLLYRPLAAFTLARTSDGSVRE